jgi:transcriptional regulator GlxA family with amidase domain
LLVQRQPGCAEIVAKMLDRAPTNKSARLAAGRSAIQFGESKPEIDFTSLAESPRISSERRDPYLPRAAAKTVRSPHIARALARMHEAPERAWTLEELSHKAGLSCVAFARIFSTSVGEPPHSYLTRWRMGIAVQLLEDTDLRLAEIAPRVGYRSEFSFSRAFKLARGGSPIQYRRAPNFDRPSGTRSNSKHQYRR